MFVRSYAVRAFNYCFGDFFGMSCGCSLMAWASAIYKRKSAGCFYSGQFVCCDCKNHAGLYFRKSNRLSGCFCDSVRKFDDIHFLFWLARGSNPRRVGLGGQVAVTSVSNPMLKRGGLAFNAGKNFATCAGV
jgi:hypothetical protein